MEDMIYLINLQQSQLPEEVQLLPKADDSLQCLNRLPTCYGFTSIEPQDVDCASVMDGVSLLQPRLFFQLLAGLSDMPTY